VPVGIIIVFVGAGEAGVGVSLFLEPPPQDRAAELPTITDVSRMAKTSRAFPDFIE
jgi:hypothetical protein